MPLPKMPTQPATLLPVNDYPKAEAGKSPVRAVAAAAVEADPVEDLISGKAVPAAKSSRARKGKAAPLAAVPATTPAPNARQAAPERPGGRQDTLAKLKESDMGEPHPVKHKPVEVNVKSSASRKADRAGGTKVFVLDTNVLMHDPTCLFRFEEHDVYLPMMTLEELDDHKKGMSEVARNARQVSRTLDALIADIDDDAIEAGIELAKLGNKDAKGRLYFQTSLLNGPTLPEGLPVGKADNQILGVVKALAAERANRAIVLVTKDINMRIKARALGLAAEDYFNDHVLEDTDLLYSGIVQLPDDFWDKHGKDMESWQENKNGNSATFYRVTGPFIPSLLVNQFVFLEPSGGEAPLQAQVREINGKTAVLQVLRDYSHTKNSVWGITARNREQNFALNLLMNPECDFVTLLGQAGTGKTLLALAAGLAQVLETKLYNEIIVTRVTVPVGEDIGFLPGTEEEKMSPWMGAFDDNLEVLNKSDTDAGDWGRAATQDLIRSRIKIKSLNFMRGRTFVNKFLIIDEAQNLTPKQMKTLVTRAGPGTKILCLGNIAQIDTPYLTEGSSGLTYVVDRFKGWAHSGHVTLARGERSRLADHASDVL
ncbi:PhoH family protein [Massilia sp. Dwa41.01b]|uniref:PhoH family protein n=1 Tax=unclassified Massilia TaxID=2609279 RepID=UPI0016041540|nr:MULTISPECIES: PhoH family protein [unclassified Massilia]QNA89871.1 PhoH family protein [Massilia sp. Dwa41.01b]QNB00759.1 PhoH family protein [Massilia sp. Se16.2.3]